MVIRRLGLAICVLAAACSDGGDDDPMLLDPCLLEDPVAGGTVELGLNDPFMTVANGAEIELVLGLQGFYMFIANARARDLRVGAEPLRGGVDFAAFGPDGVLLSVEAGCRPREFMPQADGSALMATSYFLALLPEYTSQLDGMQIKLQVTLSDVNGMRAIDERTVIARLPR